MRILLALRAKGGPLRFNEVQRELGINPNQVDRALEWLQKRFYVLARTIPGQGSRVFVEYHLGSRGRAFLDAYDAFTRAAQAHRDVLGEDPVRELASFG